MPLTQKKSPFEQLDSGASTTPVQKSHFFTGKQPAMAPTQKPQEGLFSGLSSGLEQSGEMGQQVNENVMGMLSGSSFDSHRTQQRETLQRAAQNLRAQTGEQTSHLLGQGAANRAQQGVEQSIFQGLADSELQTNIAQQEMQERGVKTAMDLAQAQQQKNVQDQQLQMQRDELYGYTDPQGNHVMGARDLAQQMFNFEVDATGRKLDLAERQMLEQVRQFDDEMDWRKKAKEMDLDEAEAQRLWASNEATLDRVFQTEMQQINHAFAERGWNYQALMQNLDYLPDEQVVDLIKHAAQEVGVDLIEYGKAHIQEAQSIADRIFDPEQGGPLSESEFNRLSENYDDVMKANPERFASSSSLSNNPTSYKTLPPRWDLSSDAVSWAKENAGKMYKHSDGKIYMVGDYVESARDRKSTGYIELIDTQTGEVKRHGNPDRTPTSSDGLSWRGRHLVNLLTAGLSAGVVEPVYHYQQSAK